MWWWSPLACFSWLAFIGSCHSDSASRSLYHITNPFVFSLLFPSHLSNLPATDTLSFRQSSHLLPQRSPPHYNFIVLTSG
ncbi:hypothetical protein L2E82_17049 [Cichorium intybus]|uniref:Uncharacterized protein n=1 Tax=Cichorium intybus TaxID=13427 RepID=A0ACB9F863_CICIN|nr:hypothetical protein L2E82_17049 [Cichorium intybus]